MPEQAEVLEPWEKLREALETRVPKRVEACLDSLSAIDRVRAILRISSKEQALLLTILDADIAAGLVEELPEEEAADILEDITASQAAAIMTEMPSDERVDVISEIEEAEATAIISKMAPNEAEEVSRLRKYETFTAGGIMVTEFLSYPAHFTIDKVIEDIRSHAENYFGYDIRDIYVIDSAKKPIGTIKINDLLLSPHEKPLTSIMEPKPYSVRTSTQTEDLVRLLEGMQLTALPVVNRHGELVGLVRRAELEEALGEKAQKSFMKASGIAYGEELRSLPLKERIQRRVSWLSINIFLNLISASIIALYQDTIASAVVLAVFLPIVSDMSGCSGNQAMAVSLRELTLGIVKPYELFWVFTKEATIGVINGVILGTILGAVIFIWKGNIYLSLVVSLAFALNNLIAVCLGGTIPLLLRLFKKDPAIASGPILTTITDMCGFFFVLSFASLMMSRIAVP